MYAFIFMKCRETLFQLCPHLNVNYRAQLKKLRMNAGSILTSFTNNTLLFCAILHNLV